MARAHLDIDAERDRNFLVVPLHDVERQLNDLVSGEVLSQFIVQSLIDLARLRHQEIREPKRNLVLGREVGLGVAIDLRCHLLVESLLLGNCPANAQSSAAVVMIGAPEPNQLGCDRVDLVEADDRCLPFRKRERQGRR